MWGVFRRMSFGEYRQDFAILARGEDEGRMGFDVLGRSNRWGCRAPVTVAVG